MLSSIVLLIITSKPLWGGVVGVCSDCHTMHYSQGGAVLSDWGQSGPYKFLVVNSCVGCHQGTSGAINSIKAPIVYHTGPLNGVGPGFTLAGGDFYWVNALGNAHGHNVDGISSADISNTPPGWDPSATPGYLNDGQIANGAAAWNVQLRCAGTYGCHGRHDKEDPLEAIEGAHHKNPSVSDQVTNPTNVATSYRFLSGIKGLEDSSWEYNATSSTHNEYYGVDGNSGYTDKQTISYLCAECHGYYHSDIGSGASPWLRHPTDVVVPSTGEYAGYTTYNLIAPVARPAVPSTSSSTVTPGDATTGTGAIVMCLSCHRAHGSPYRSILRWDYKNWPTSGINGCTVCHTAKD